MLFSIHLEGTYVYADYLFSFFTSFIDLIFRNQTMIVNTKESQLSSVARNHVWLSVTPWTAAPQASLSITNSRSLLKLMSIESVMPHNHSSSVVPFSFFPTDCFPAGSSVHGISQARILELVDISFSRGIFLTQGSNLSLLHWQADSLPLSHLRSLEGLSILYLITLIQSRPYNQSYDLSSSHVQMWGLNHKEDWAPKNWCFWTELLEKTLESPLDSKDIKPGNPKGTQSWIFIERTEAETEAPILWLTHWKRP